MPHPRRRTKPVSYLLSPVIALVVAVAVTILTSWIVRRQRPLRVDRWFRRLQLFFGLRAIAGPWTMTPKGMGIIATALSGGLMRPTTVPYWVILCMPSRHGWRHPWQAAGASSDHGTAHHQAHAFGGFAAETAGVSP